MKSTAFAALLALILAAPAVARAPETTRIGQYDATNSGQRILLPSGPVQVTVNRVTIAAGTSLPVHKHPFQRFGYVEAGTIRVSNLDTGKVVEYHPGEMIIEARDQWHTGLALGDTPVVLLVFDQTPPGQVNMVAKPLPR
ncbi:quercetin dioxygenase-like cupin family protein [Caulobacter ginsengisoli]|uniref:Quercetin dioxygenase-like cupin family protein n=1 Tax=Caulobacter ginsengisoli TaxID=400775 RepID=A0ABU0IYH7_9CAUL|nr:cupin domain-containing protein [Caulobacter ginsengisoli]MDQ0466109.1 quercetin dioxygenase-like cupin family protein [Caulobacter ginsengisoli]